jgi:hypothetical protein
MTIKQTGGIFGRNPTFNDVDIDGDLTVAGDLTVQGTTITVDSATAQSIVLGDNDKMTFGAGSDLQIYHDGSNSYINDTGTGNLLVRAADSFLLQDTGGKTYLRTYINAQTEISYNNALKLATTSTGVDVTGTITSDGLTVDGTATIGNLYNWTFDDSTLGAGASLSAATTVHFGTAGNNSFVTYTNAKRRLAISNGGDISFYEDTGTTPKFFWDASEESVTIGTTVNSQVPLNVSAATVGSSNAIAFLRNSSADGNGLVVDVTNTPTDYVADFRIGNTSKVRIDSSGNVGIGTDSPASYAKFTIQGAGTEAIPTDGLVQSYDNSTLQTIWNSDSAANYSGIKLETRTAGASGWLIANQWKSTYLGDLVFHRRTGASSSGEAMRIDSSGNLLVGTTAAQDPTSTTTNGHTFYGGTANVAVHSRNNDNALAVQRTGSDGVMINLFKDTAQVGSIGTVAGDLTIGDDDIAIRFDTGAGLVPWDLGANTTGGLARDAAIDIGVASARFKDLYLSGGVYLGGTTSANKLDDYETGTWTPSPSRFTGGGITATYNTQDGYYTKVGNLVTCSFKIDIASISSQGTSFTYIAGLPYAPARSYYDAGATGNNTGLATVDVVSFVAHSDSRLFLRQSGNTSSNSTADWAVGTLSGTITYMTS